MTVGIATPRVEYDENGVTLVHNITFPFFDADEIKVTRTDPAGVVTVLALNVGYTVTGGDNAVGTIAKTSAGAVGGKILIERATKRSQLIHYEPGDEFPAASHEEALDRDIMIEQEQDLKILTAEQIRQLLADSLEGVGISVGYDPDTQKITLTNLYDDEFVRDMIAAALVEGNGINIVADDALETITISAEILEALPDCVELSGDQQTNSGGGGGASSGLTGEQVQDLVAGMIVGHTGAGVTATYDDPAGTLTITNTDRGSSIAAADAELIRDTIGAALVQGAQITITVNDGGDTITIASTALAASYRGLAVVTKAGAFLFDDTHGGKSILYTGGAAAATLQPNATEALSDGWGTVIRNNGSGVLTIALGAAVHAYVNGATASSAASIAVGGVASINRWGANEFTIIGPKVS